jgi:HSP20 family molecular chaperone IbpA
MTNITSFDALLDDILYTPSRLRFDNLNKYYYKNAVYESRINKDGLLEINVNAVGHDKSNINLDVTDTHIHVSSIKPEGSSAFVNDLDFSFKLGEEYDGTTTKAAFNNGLLTLTVDKKEERKAKRIKLS